MITAASLGHLAVPVLPDTLKSLHPAFLPNPLLTTIRVFPECRSVSSESISALDDLHRELAHDSPSSGQLTNADVPSSAVGDGIIESQCGYRRHLGLIPDAHPRQGSLRPIATVFLRAAYPRLSASHQRYIQGNTHSFTIRPVHEIFPDGLYSCRLSSG